MTARLLHASVLALFMVALAASPASATAIYTYKKDEYALIADGESPDGQYSIAAHGDGAEGDENFHLYLMTDHGGKMIGPLEEVEHILDTHPKSFEALWSADSRFVALSYRSDRHIGSITIYRIEKGRAYAITGPTLIDTAAGFNVLGDENVEVRALWPLLSWTGPGRFTLKEGGILGTTGQIAKALEKFGTVKESAAAADNPALVEYQLEGEGEIVAGDKFKILSVKVPADPSTPAPSDPDADK